MSAVRNPFTGEIIAEVPAIDAHALDRAAALAHESFQRFRHAPAHHRADLLMKIGEIVKARRTEFAETILAEAGKPIVLAEAEVDRAVWTLLTAADEARRFHGETFVADAFASGENHMAMAKRFPIGVVYGMTPFNFPLNLVAHKIAPALACGNTIIIKPSPRTPLSAMKLAQAIGEAGAPAGVVQVVNCANDLATHLIADDRIHHVSFTGSVPIGWHINELAAKAKKRATLELGGNAGCIVHDDADIACAISLIAAGAFSYAGQSCISVQRLFVHEKIFDAFTSQFVEHVRHKIRCGDPRDRNVIVAPMIDDAAKSRVLAAIEAARRAGAKILTGGQSEGPCVLPTVITGADAKLDVCATEIFAPVVVVDRYRDFDNAIARVNASPFGLQAGVFTRDIDRILRACNELEVGGLMINQVPTFRLENMPYGGVKQSGLGREGVRFAINEMTELRTLVINAKPGANR